MNREKFERVLIFTAHADDCEFFCGATAAKLAAAGAEISEIICTDNSRGSHDMASTELVAQSRDIEAREAAKIIGKKDVHFLGYPDGFLDEIPKNELRRIFIEWIRRIKPDLVMSFDAFASFDPHPDHRHVAIAAMEAVAFAHLPLYHPEQIEAGLSTHLTPNCYWFAKHDGLSNHVEDISDFIDTKIEALCAHTSQMHMTIEDFRSIIEATGRHEELLPLLDKDNYRPAIEMLIRVWAANVGKKISAKGGEAFRIERAGDVFEQAT